MGILTHVSIEDLASNACEFENMSNDQRKHPAEPSISLLIVSTLSPCHLLVVINLNRLDQEKKMLNKIKYSPRGGPVPSLKQIKSQKRGRHSRAVVKLNKNKNSCKGRQAVIHSQINFLKTERAVMVVCRGRKCGYGGECLAR